jgi:uncharacterized protein
MGFKRLQERLLSVGLCLAVGFVCGCSQEGLIFYPEKISPGYTFDYQGPFTEITLPVDGAAIHALLFKADKPRGVVLYFHGNAGSLRTWGDVATDFTRRGYDVFIPDYRGFGKSTGNISNEAEFLQDGAAAYDYLARHYPEQQIVIYGRSIGTGVAVHTAGMRAPRMVILESPFFNLIDLAAFHYPLIPVSLIRSFLRYPLRADLWIGKIRCPIYIFHGTADFTIPYRESERLIPLCSDRGRLIRLEGGGHNNLSDFARYQEQLDVILGGKGE